MASLPKPNRNRTLESTEDVFVHDTIDADIPLDPACRAIAIGTSGTLKVKTLKGHDRILPAMPDGFVWPVQCVTIYTGSDTTATNVAILP